MIRVSFLKVEAAGNDFVLIDNLRGDYKFPYKKFATVVCDRHRGVGADGLLVLESSERADFKMRYLNSDGSEGSMCGNGGRAISLYAAQITRKNELNFEALNHIYKAKIVGDKRVLLCMKDPEKINKNVIFYNKQSIPIWSIDTGAPHTVIFWKDISSTEKFDDISILEIGKYIRLHEQFAPNGTNVNFINPKGDNKIAVRTYEKGVENETLSCGTGSIASAIISVLELNLSPPIKVIPLSKDELIINFSIIKGQISNVSIEGNVNFVFQGVLIFYELENKISINDEISFYIKSRSRKRKSF